MNAPPSVDELAGMPLPDIVHSVGDYPSADRLRSASLACLTTADGLLPEDLARPTYLAAAQTFATLSVSATLAETLYSGAYGFNVADAVLQTRFAPG